MNATQHLPPAGLQAVTWYRWDVGYHMIAQYDDPDTDWAPEGLQYTFPHDPSRLFGTALAADAGADPAAGAYRYFLQDAYGSTRQLRLQDKSLAGAWEYSPYGTLYHGGGTESVFAYTGQIYDANAGLHYFPFRYYNPALARWLTPEPTGADGPNLYWYAKARPTNGVDHFGLWYIDLGGGVISGPIGPAGTFGYMIGSGGIYMYGGCGAGAGIGGGGSLTFSFHGVSEGLNYGVQGSGGFLSFQVGCDSQTKDYVEFGFSFPGTPSGYGGPYYVTKIYDWPDPPSSLDMTLNNFAAACKVH